MNARDSVHLTGDRNCSDAGLAMGRKELGAVPQAPSAMVAATKDARPTARPAGSRCLFMMAFLPGTRWLFAPRVWTADPLAVGMDCPESGAPPGSESSACASGRPQTRRRRYPPSAM